MDAAIMDQRYLTDIEVSRITGLARATLIRHRFDRKGIPFYKVGRSVRYKMSDVKKYMEEHRIETN